MTTALHSVFNFFLANIPSPRAAIVGIPLGLGWAFVCLWAAAYLKQIRGVRTGYTRKVFHLLIFLSVAVMQVWVGSPGVCLFGAMTSLVVFYAVLCGDGHPLYEAMAREKDAPLRTYYVIAPYFATLIGGLASVILFGPLALVGYLVAGLGDAIGEPVGTRFGRHTYAVPSLSRVRSFRSLEGSSAVLIVSGLALAAALFALPNLHLPAHVLLWLPVIALVVALVEAVSPHGWDNATMQIVPTSLVWCLVRGLA